MNNDWNNFSPRFGFAWHPTGLGDRRCRGGYGVFFVRPFPRLYNNFVESAPFSPTITLNGVDIQDPYGSAKVRNPFPPFAPVDLTCLTCPSPSRCRTRTSRRIGASVIPGVEPDRRAAVAVGLAGAGGLRRQ